MKRMTAYICDRAHGADGVSESKLTGAYCRGEFEATALVERLAQIEDILGDIYDLDRLRELAEADMAGRCVVLPVKPGETVRFARNPRAKHEKVACVTLYEGGKICLGFHDVGYKETWVDEWSEDDAENYVLAEKEGIT